MDDGINFEARMGDGSKPNSGFFGGLLGVGKRLLTGESLFLTHFTNVGVGKKKLHSLHLIQENYAYQIS